MLFIWRKNRRVQYIDFDKSEETRFITGKQMDTYILDQGFKCDPDFIKSVRLYVDSGFPVLVDFDDETCQVQQSTKIIASSDNKKKTLKQVYGDFLKKSSNKKLKGGGFNVKI